LQLLQELIESFEVVAAKSQREPRLFDQSCGRAPGVEFIGDLHQEIVHITDVVPPEALLEYLCTDLVPSHRISL